MCSYKHTCKETLRVGMHVRLLNCTDLINTLVVSFSKRQMIWLEFNCFYCWTHSIISNCLITLSVALWELPVYYWPTTHTLGKSYHRFHRNIDHNFFSLLTLNIINIINHILIPSSFFMRGFIQSTRPTCHKVSIDIRYCIVPRLNALINT